MSHGTAAEATYSCLNELENPGPWTTALGVFSICFSATVGIPQAYKIYARRSSRGISMATLGLGNIGGFLYVLNLLILHYNQIVLSYQGDFAYWARAQRSVTFVWVELVNSISMVFVFFVAARFEEDEPGRFTWEALGIDIAYRTRDATRLWAIAQVAIISLAWFPALLVLASEQRCEPLMVYGNALGAVVAVNFVCKFMPQLIASIKAEGSHSLSYLTYGVDAGSGVVAWAQKVFVTEERVSSWAPPLFLHALEVATLAINWRNDQRRKEGRMIRGGGGGAAFGMIKRSDDQDDEDDDGDGGVRGGVRGVEFGDDANGLSVGFGSTSTSPRTPQRSGDRARWLAAERAV
jgi:uncharacterized protein with PQ loop repeat